MVGGGSFSKASTGRGRIGRRFASVALLAGLLSGCLGGGDPLSTYDLSASTVSRGARPPHGLLVIADPTATAPFDTDRIVVRTGPDSLAYLKGAQWTDRLPRLVQNRLVQTFDSAHLMKSVARPQDGLSADYRLLVDIWRFEIDTTSGEAVVQMSVKIVADHTGRIVAGEIFQARVPGSAADGPGASRALDSALSEIMPKIVAWVGAKA